MCLNEKIIFLKPKQPKTKICLPKLSNFLFQLINCLPITDAFYGLR